MTSTARELARTIVLADRYTLVRPIATGGMAEIFLARQKALAGFDKEVVVKLLRDRYRSDPRVVEMFMNEARIGAVLSHPNVVHVYDVSEHDKQPFIVMEHIDGDELSQLCRRGLELAKFLPLEHAVDLVRQAAEALGYFHAKREGGEALDIIHRDISPSNLIVTRDGIMKVIDFGIARVTWPGRKGDEDRLVPGKYNYMSPEQVRGERVDARSDIYSLGIVLYEITVGKRLYKGRPEEVIQKITRGRIKPPTFIRRQFPPALEAIVLRALEPHREDRYATAYELANDLEEFLRTASLKSGPVRIAQYLDELRMAEGGERRPELVIAGEAWLDDDGEEALDFERGFSVNVKPVAPAAPPMPLAAVPAPMPLPLPGVTPMSTQGRPEALDRLIEKLEARAEGSSLAPPAAKGFEDEEAKTAVAEDVSRTANLRPMPRGAADLAISSSTGDLDADFGEDIPTDASLNIPEIDVNDPANRDMTARLLLAEPTSRFPLMVPPPSRTPSPKTPMAGIAVPLGETRKPSANLAVPLRSESGAVMVPLQAPPTGRVPLSAPMSTTSTPPTATGRAPQELPLATPVPPTRPSLLQELDPASSTDTPLPPVPDPRLLDDTARHPLAEPLRQHLALAGNLKLLRADESSSSDPLSDSMSMTIPEERTSRPKPQPSARPAAKKGRAAAKKRSTRNFRQRAASLELSSDPVPTPTFGDGILATKPKKTLPWPVIGGTAALIILILFLLFR
jgi:tRNA A-37 threonylcarbamoyl transferase component Bud32